MTDTSIIKARRYVVLIRQHISSLKLTAVMADLQQSFFIHKSEFPYWSERVPASPLEEVSYNLHKSR